MKGRRILLVEPPKGKKYHTPYPPLALLKLATYHKERGDRVRFVRGFSDNGFEPDLVYITSLFTYAYEAVHDAISYYSQKHRKARIVVGGIYATLCADHLREAFRNRIQIRKGIVRKLEKLLPDYSLIPEWKSSILFSSRGCVRRCPFCSVPVLEPRFEAKRSIRHLVYPGHEKVVFWDNNILASPYWRQIFNELEELDLEVDFNQGLDARLLTQEVAERLRALRVPITRLAYDSDGIRKALKRAIHILKDVGVRGRGIIVYCLYNHQDTPSSFLDRVRDLLEWGVVAYPMRYEPLEPRPKNTYVSASWTAEELEMVAKARRVIGYGGAFPPYEGLRKKVINARDFREAFQLRPKEASAKGAYGIPFSWGMSSEKGIR